MIGRDAVIGRRSVRRFLDQPVAIETVRQILADASRSPSGTNSQPWLVHVVTGAARDRVCKDVTAAAIAGHAQQEYPYFPDDAGEPYLSRRRKVGFDLYALYGVDRKDIEGRKRAMLMNFDFFGAPVGLFFTHGKEDAVRVVARPRHVHAERHDPGPRPRPRDLPAGSLGSLWPDRAQIRRHSRTTK